MPVAQSWGAELQPQHPHKMFGLLSPQNWGGWDKRILWAQMTVSLAKFARSGLVGDPVSKNKVRTLEKTLTSQIWSPHECVHMCFCTYTTNE